MKLVIIDYNAGNTQSVIFALQRLGIEPIISGDADVIRSADKIIFPGQGEASTTMRYLKEKKLDLLIPTLQQPFLGICIGMQLLCSHSEENNTTCLGVFSEKVKRFIPKKGEKVPHIGWNTIKTIQKGIFDESMTNEYVYFVHSYYVEKSVHTSCEANYCTSFSAGLQKGNFHAAQFHPEKSGTIGQRMLENFLKI
jgi:imidazole glycerol-phosphate synthase subunit HisH